LSNVEQENLLIGVLVVILLLAASNRNGINLSAGGALSSWGGAGVGGVQHVQVLVYADSSEDLVIHHAADIENQIQVLLVKKWWLGWRFFLIVLLLVFLLFVFRLQFIRNLADVLLVALWQLFLYQTGGEFLNGSVAGTVCCSWVGRQCVCSKTRRGVPIVRNHEHETFRKILGEFLRRNLLNICSRGRICLFGLLGSLSLG
jgi:hypothetical protein